jgi:hypothetical protein
VRAAELKIGADEGRAAKRGKNAAGLRRIAGYRLIDGRSKAILALPNIASILHGARPAELAIPVPTDVTFGANRSALHRLGINLPDEVTAKVTEWID